MKLTSITGHFAHETEGPWPLQFKHSRWWKRRSRSKFASRYAWGTDRVSECKVDVKSTWIPTWHRIDHVSWWLGSFSKRPIRGRPNTKPGDHGTPKVHNCWFIIFYHVRGYYMNENLWNNTWLRVWSHMTSHYTWGPVTTLHDFGSVLRQPLDTFFWALTISWSRLLACVWSDPKTLIIVVYGT